MQKLEEKDLIDAKSIEDLNPGESKSKSTKKTTKNKGVTTEEGKVKKKVVKEKTTKEKKVSEKESKKEVKKETKDEKKNTIKRKTKSNKDKLVEEVDNNKKEGSKTKIATKKLTNKVVKTKSTAKKDKDVKEVKENKEFYDDESTKKTKNTSKKEVKTLATGEISLKEPISDFDSYLFHEGKHYEAYSFMGAKFKTEKRKKGVRFTTWAPNAESIIVVGDFSNWEVKDEYKMDRITEMGLWSVFIPKLENGIKYKYAVTNKDSKNTVLKADPYAVESEIRPDTASVLHEDTKFKWSDKKWINNRNKTNIYDVPVNIYEVHLGSWKKEDGKFLTYKELSVELPKYLKEMGYTHVEIMPLMEHPLDESWGYQVTGYYSLTSRYGLMEDFKLLVNTLHKEGIGVLLDWVPGHFCKDEHGLYKFDGSSTYEYKDECRAENIGWGACNFDVGRPEVKSFLISNALYWFREFHIDGLRVDAVANMLYLDYGRQYGQWSPNINGGRENLQAEEFFKELNTAVFKELSGVMMIAEESSQWPGVSKPVAEGGLGFTFKWNMGWMNDTLKYIEIDPLYRKYHHNQITFSMMYNYSERFMLPISHDEVVHGKKSLIGKMYGDYWNKFAGVRAYTTFMMGHPGKKLLFMGSEFGQFIEWRSGEELEWYLIDQYDTHKKLHEFFKELNNFYKNNKALWELDYDEEGFEWIDPDNNEKSILSFIRRGKNKEDTLIFITNFTPVVYYDFKIGVPFLGEYKEIFNSDSGHFGGSHQVMDGLLVATNEPCDREDYSLKIKVPPMATLILSVDKIIIEKDKEDNNKIIKQEKELEELNHEIDNEETKHEEINHEEINHEFLIEELKEKELIKEK